MSARDSDLLRSSPDLERFVAESLGLMRGIGVLPSNAESEALKHAPVLERLAGDGSTRTIYRVRDAGVPVVLVLNPLPAERAHPDENEAFLAVREFLHRKGIRVPRFYAADLERGYLLLEDLGDERLFEAARREGWHEDGREAGPLGKREARPERTPVEGFYREAIRILVAMQALGEPAFRSTWTSNPVYDEDFIVAMESGYFYRELACEIGRGAARPGGDPGSREGGVEPGAEAGVEARAMPPELEDECRALARGALSGADHPFMHRDFQSRNLMIHAGALAVIDFQGARRGPGEYDLASLLYDPYVRMPGWMRERMFAYFLDTAAAAGIRGLPDVRSQDALRSWRRRLLANAADRLMQALGAYGKLGLRLGRPGFREHIAQALEELEAVLEELGGCPRLLALVRELRPAAGVYLGKQGGSA